MLFTMNSIKNINSYPKYLILWLISLVFISCERKYELDLSLSVASTEIILTPEEGRTQIMVYSNGDWTVSVKEDTDWLTLDKKKGTGNDNILFSYNGNFGVTRKATLVIQKGNEIKEISIIQNGQNAAFRFSKSKYTVTRNPFHIVLPIVNDLKSNINRIKVEYLYDDETSEKWVQNVQLTEKGFEFDLLENNYGRLRTVRIYLTVFDALDKEYTVYTDVDQTTGNPTLVPKTVESYITRRPKLDTVIVKGNVGALFSEFQNTVTYENGNDWIENVELANDSLLIIAVRGNESGAQRVGHVNVKLVHNGISYIDFTHKVVQTANDYDIMSIESLKSLISGPTGEIKINQPLKVIEAIVVGDAANHNMDTNPSTSFNVINYTEAPRTNYIQNLLGTSGLQLKFLNQSDNAIRRYSKVLLSVHGLTLVKEANPLRYTLKGLRDADFVSREDANPADYTIQTKFISELRDSDVHTYVKLKKIAIGTSYGCFTNINMGYVRTTPWNLAGSGTTNAYHDAIPNSVFDANGDNIKMIVNTANSWSREPLPVGVGTLSGIVVFNQLKRFGSGEGDIGRYSIRPVSKSDVDLYSGTKPVTIVEWRMFSPNNLTERGVLTNQNADGFAAVVGTGRVSATTATTATLGANPIQHTDYSSKAIPTSAFQFSQSWWNTTTNSPEAVIFKFSTLGHTASKDLSLNFTIGGGSGTVTTLNVPVNWEVRSSLDGVNYELVSNSSFAVRPLPIWGVNHDFTCSGLLSHSIRLPKSLLNRDNVYLKIQPRNNVCGENLANGGDSGRITATSNKGDVNLRFGAVSINYIQQ